jgi:glycosyltransferase involved in cell wall biosynthesis
VAAGEPAVISVVIRARNAARDLRRCLRALRRQALPAGRGLEVVVVDNESTDGTRDVATRWGARVVPIGCTEFTWGRALNRGIAAASGDLVILLSSDAYPADEHWLGHMVAPFGDPKIAAAYGRQIPRADAPAAEVWRLAHSFGAAAYSIEHAEAMQGRGGKLTVCSNACAAIRKSAWVAAPFSETLKAAEEVPWLTDVLGRGWKAVYAPSALAYHSHRECVFRFAFRMWEIHENGTRRRGQHPFMPLPFAKVIGWMWKSGLRIFFANGIPLRRRVEGLWRLPFESCAFCVVALSAIHPPLRSRLRQLAWR